jgi:hypothetical protein
MVNKNLKLIILFWAFIVSISCKKEQAEASPDICVINTVIPIFNTNNYADLPFVSYNTNVCGLLPLGKNHFWIYKDSIFDNSGVFVEIKMDTLTVAKTVQSLADNSIWWKMKSNRTKGIFNQFIYTTDSTVYFIDLLFGFGYNNNFESRSWFKLFNQDSVKHHGGIGDVAFLQQTKNLQNTVTVPAGSFSNCIENNKNKIGGDFRYITTIKPSVGIIKFSLYDSPGPPSSNILPSYKRQVSELISYSID